MALPYAIDALEPVISKTNAGVSSIGPSSKNDSSKISYSPPTGAFFIRTGYTQGQAPVF